MAQSPAAAEGGLTQLNIGKLKLKGAKKDSPNKKPVNWDETALNTKAKRAQAPLSSLDAEAAKTLGGADGLFSSSGTTTTTDEGDLFSANPENPKTDEGFLGVGPSAETEAADDLLVSRLLEREKGLGDASIFARDDPKEPEPVKTTPKPASDANNVGLDDDLLDKFELSLGDDDDDDTGVPSSSREPDVASGTTTTTSITPTAVADDFDYAAYIQSQSSETAAAGKKKSGLFDD